MDSDHRSLDRLGDGGQAGAPGAGDTRGSQHTPAADQLAGSHGRAVAPVEQLLADIHQALGRIADELATVSRELKRLRGTAQRPAPAAVETMQAAPPERILLDFEAYAARQRERDLNEP